MFDPNKLSQALGELATSQHSVSFTLVDLTVVSCALDVLRDRLTSEMRGADPDMVRTCANMIGDVSVLENRIDTLLKMLVTEKVQEFLSADGATEEN